MKMKALIAGAVLLFIASLSGGAGAVPSPWSAITPLQPAQVTDAQYYGQTVAVAGNLAVVGANDGSVNGVLNRGLVYTYARSGGVWTTQALPLTLANGMANDDFGGTLALSNDWLLVTSTDQTPGNPGATIRAVIHTFVRSGSSWAPSGPPLSGPESADPRDYFGGALAVSGDTLAVGAPGAYSGGSGRVYLYVRHDGRWARQGPALAAPGAGIDESFGASVALDGDTLIVGSPRYADPPVPGVAYVYVRQAGVWARQGDVLRSNLNGDDGFGRAVALSRYTTVIGAPAAYGGAGAVYVYTHSQSGTWLRQAALSGESLGSGAYLGSALAISGEQAVVAAPGMSFVDGKSRGALLLYGRQANVWSLHGDPQRVAPDEDRSMGQAVGLSGSNALVGAHNFDGAAYALRACATEPCCTSDSECAATEYCSRTGSCQAQTLTGNPCDCFEPGCRICVDPASCGSCSYGPQPANEEAGAAGAAEGGGAGVSPAGGAPGVAGAGAGAGRAGTAAGGVTAAGGSTGGSTASAGSSPISSPSDAGAGAICAANEACPEPATTASACGCRLGARVPFDASAAGALGLLLAACIRRKRTPSSV